MTPGALTLLAAVDAQRRESERERDRTRALALVLAWPLLVGYLAAAVGLGSLAHGRDDHATEHRWDGVADRAR